jgi:hypothetical protein
MPEKAKEKKEKEKHVKEKKEGEREGGRQRRRKLFWSDGRHSR